MKYKKYIYIFIFIAEKRVQAPTNFNKHAWTLNFMIIYCPSQKSSHELGFIAHSKACYREKRIVALIW